MLRFLRRRLLLLIPGLLGLSVITFAVSRIVPGDPVKLAAGPQARPEQIQKLAAEFGMDRPLPEQYFRYMTGLVQGNWGYSISTKRAVGPDLLTFFAATGQCVFYGYYYLIANMCVILTRIAQHTYAKYFFGPAVVGYIEPGFLLYHF